MNLRRHAHSRIQILKLSIKPMMLYTHKIDSTVTILYVAQAALVSGGVLLSSIASRFVTTL